MPVFSYLAYPVQGAKEQLRKNLVALDYCSNQICQASAFQRYCRNNR
jgi:hypothetical protein